MFKIVLFVIILTGVSIKTTAQTGRFYHSDYTCILDIFNNNSFRILLHYKDRLYANVTWECTGTYCDSPGYITFHMNTSRFIRSNDLLNMEHIARYFYINHPFITEVYFKLNKRINKLDRLLIYHDSIVFEQPIHATRYNKKAPPDFAFCRNSTDSCYRKIENLYGISYPYWWCGNGCSPRIYPVKKKWRKYIKFRKEPKYLLHMKSDLFSCLCEESL